MTAIPDKLATETLYQIQDPPSRTKPTPSKANFNKKSPPIKQIRLEVVVTYRCNAVCRFCNRGVGTADVENGDMTVRQARNAVNQLLAKDLFVERCTLGGGEPLLNPDLEGIAEQFARLPNVRGRVLSNGEDEPKRASIKLPSCFTWVVSPIQQKHHWPFYVSPLDLGLEAVPEKCSVIGYCGVGLDAFGWSSCGVAGILGRVLRINPYNHRKPVLKGWHNLCRHCPYGLSRREQKKLYEKCEMGEVQHPTPTFREGLKQHRTDPMEFKRY